MSESTIEQVASELRLWRNHPAQTHCPRCGEDCGREGLSRLAYVFTACSCPASEYQHLYEQIWHLACLRLDAGALVESQLLRDVLYAVRGRKRLAGLVKRLESALGEEVAS